jgi:uncharacterized protein
MKTPTAFDWDDAKAATNLAKHGVRFAFAVRVFLDPALVIEETIRDEDDEARHKAIGLIGGKLYAVVFTMRGDVCRLISARRTNRREDRIYG